MSPDPRRRLAAHLDPDDAEHVRAELRRLDYTAELAAYTVALHVAIGRPVMGRRVPAKRRGSQRT